uniref:RING-type domain-containing protein n=1 Tax=Romanomermis culicivorax TaxID=13658 RepID=A0A915JCY5_ROMCU
MFQALCCSICCEVMHDSISLQPCGHCFCGGCFSDWMQRSRRCPECRLKVKRVSKNHRMNNLIDIYLQSHAEKVRPTDDLRNLDAKNKFASDIFVMPAGRDKSLNFISSDSSTSGDSDSDSYSTSSDDTDSDLVDASANYQKGGVKSVRKRFAICISAVVVMDVVGVYANLKDHLTRSGKSWSQFQQECMQQMDAGELNCQDKVAYDLKSKSIICLACALKNLRDLAYEYRKRLQVEDKFRKRPNCWYGRNCRTQKTKLAHAEKLNHICEQTKF